MGDTVVIIGGDAAGMSAASKAKRENEALDVIVFEKGEWVSYAACGMPYFLKGEIDELEDLVQVTPEMFREKRDIDLRTGHEVTEIHPERDTVTVEYDGGTFEQSYDHLLIGTGASAVIPPFDGLDLDGVFTLQSMDNAGEINEYLDSTSVESAAIIGGGYIGVEMAEALAAHDIDITLFEMLPHILSPFGETVGKVVAEHIQEQGVTVHLETAVDGFRGDDSVEAVVADGTEQAIDLAIVGVGVSPNVGLARDARITVGETGAISTDEYGRTNIENIYAAGDCAEATHVVTGEPAHVPLALTANRAGRAIGQTIAGNPQRVGTIAGTAIVKAFDYGAARTGILDEERARTAGFDPVSVTIDSHSRAHYYPGGDELTVTLVADSNSQRVLGGSLVGTEGVKRIDTVATALGAEMTVAELMEQDLAYAPPFSPVWDPILTAAKVLNGKI